MSFVLVKIYTHIHKHILFIYTQRSDKIEVLWGIILKSVLKFLKHLENTENPIHYLTEIFP